MRLTADALGVTIGSRVLYKDLGFDWCAPTLVAVVGPSGSGKSTLLSVLMGWTAPTTGRVRTDPDGAEVWLVPQNAPLLDSRSVRENLEVALLAERSRGGRDRATAVPRPVDEVLAAFALADQAATTARHLSGGERQRVALARAALRRPDVLLADEVTARLDPQSVRTVTQALRLLADDGTLVVAATHDERVWSSADHVLDLGRVAR
ncbi:MAG TPA: ATP-binding cassette domain-containing protein [Cellulomonas sp.]